jgi:hypothetical protein
LPFWRFVPRHDQTPTSPTKALAPAEIIESTFLDSSVMNNGVPWSPRWGRARRVNVERHPPPRRQQILARPAVLDRRLGGPVDVPRRLASHHAMHGDR